MSQFTINMLAQLSPSAVTGDNIVDYGWHDWWSKDTVIARNTPQFIALAKRIADKFGNCPMFLKQNSPFHSSKYESFVIQDKDHNNYYWIENSNHPREFDVIKVHHAPGTEHVTLATALNKKQLAEFINTLEVPEGCESK